MDVIPVPLVLGLFIGLTACFCYRSTAATSESGEASSASRSPSPPSSRAYSGPPHVPRTNVRLHNRRLFSQKKPAFPFKFTGERPGGYWNKFSQMKPAFPFKFTGKRPGGYWNKSAGKGFYASFRPYGQQRFGSRAAP
ncbi:hypothetical protein E2C01_062020 [Portunus trituberculatus]|uniref:Uncharacterized protein n=1 Tax=Portunus trituberculatus TaxID=210409 RepID=A0A5B7HGW1_PORTR|nr:hypothetical protein [Portunus trituberculatus]